MSRFSKGCWIALGTLVLSSAVVLGAKLRESGLWVVEEESENFRDSPNGRKLGTLVEGVEIEQVERDGEWVRFRLEGWIWGPSLRGFAVEEPQEKKKKERPRLPLQEKLPEIKRFVNDGYGAFYGIELDEIGRRLVVRFRVRDLGREELELRQMRVQHKVFEILEGEVEFTHLRIETNRPDGSGQVGVEIAETKAGEIRRLGDDAEVDEWKKSTRTSADGGETWNE
jgi:hypothetical protein